MKLTERHAIPEQCARCPHLKHLTERSDTIDSGQGDVFDIIGGRFDKDDLKKRLGMESMKMIADEREVDELLEEIPGLLSSHVDEIFGAISKVQDRIESEALALEDGCPGTLRMRATDRLDYQVTVTICGSPQVRNVVQHNPDVSAIADVDFKKLS